MEPVVRAVLYLNPGFDFTEQDLVTDRWALASFLNIANIQCGGTNMNDHCKPFKVAAEVLGDTVIFIKSDSGSVMRDSNKNLSYSQNARKVSSRPLLVLKTLRRTTASPLASSAMSILSSATKRTDRLWSLEPMSQMAQPSPLGRPAACLVWVSWEAVSSCRSHPSSYSIRLKKNRAFVSKIGAGKPGSLTVSATSPLFDDMCPEDTESQVARRNELDLRSFPPRKLSARSSQILSIQQRESRRGTTPSPRLLSRKYAAAPRAEEDTDPW